MAGWDRNERNDRAMQLSDGEINTLISYILQGASTGASVNIFSKDGPIAKLGKNIPMHQLRKFHSEILSIEDMVNLAVAQPKSQDFGKIKIKLAKLEPVVYYTMARVKDINILGNFMIRAIGEINKENDIKSWREKFIRFKEIFDSVIAYSKKEREKGG
ncbi:MAG: type III-A CRISPR-associated protein Csm2 [Thermoplasmata archaeon]|nr:type III-A CRISPR-associated protein Csm2 [Thermoplasmata archaeon]